MTLNYLNLEVNQMCAVCVSDTSGGQIALFIIILSFTLLGLLRVSWNKYFKEDKKSIK